jgi:DNA-binding beta-propeller fold protein YncE
MLLGASRLKRRILVCVVGVWAALSFLSCGGSSKPKNPPSGLKERVLASQGVSSTLLQGRLVFINGTNDTIAPVSPISAGTSPGLMALNPNRSVLATFDNSTNTVFAVDTTTESGIGSVRLPGTTSSMVFPVASPIGYAAVPSATVNGFSFMGAIDVMNFSTAALSTIAVNNAQTVVSNSNGTELLVFSADSDSMTVLFPTLAAPPVDTSCYSNPPNSVCDIVPGFDRPVFAVIDGSTAYVLNCGAQCGGTQASVMVFDMNSRTITKTETIPVDAATTALLNNSTLYVAGTSPTNNACTGQTTAATICGRLNIIDLGSKAVVGSAVITDGYHDRIDMTSNGQIFVGSHDCTNIGNINNPVGEVRGCLSIFRTQDNSVLIPPDNGDVLGLQGFTSRNVEYVAEGGALRVYDTNKDILLINDFVPQGSINVVGFVGDIKAIDFF